MHIYKNQNINIAGLRKEINFFFIHLEKNLNFEWLPIWSLEKAALSKYNRNFHVRCDHSICLYDTFTLLIFAKW